MPSRKNLLTRLLNVLDPQRTDEVEIIIESDDGQMAIGKKRNILLKKATGDYISFVDDDDLVTTHYVGKVLQAIETKPDCVGLQGIITFQGKSPRIFIHSMKYDKWFEENNVYYRCPNHLNPVKRDIALQVMFPENNFGEDRDYSQRLFPLLKNEVHINDTIYHYLYEKEAPPKPSVPRYVSSRLKRWWVRLLSVR
jgi:glycosyltransferase involved in cell wall biosynthesis